MTDRPGPQPLPAPGPPPHPSGTTHPQPTRPTTPPPPPRPTNPSGHLPIGALGDRLPRLGEMIRDLERAAIQMIGVAGRQYDMTSALGDEFEPYGPSFVDRKLGNVVANARAVLAELNDLTTIGLPPVGSAVQYPGPSDSSACLSGGSASHPVRRPGEGLSPGLVAAAPTVHGIDESEATLPGRDAGESSDPWEANAARPAWCPPGATPATGAGPSPDPRPGCAEGARPAHDAADPPGVGFTLPVTQRFTMPGTERIARSINEALTGRSW